MAYCNNYVYTYMYAYIYILYIYIYTRGDIFSGFGSGTFFVSVYVLHIWLMFDCTPRPLAINQEIHMIGLAKVGGLGPNACVWSASTYLACFDKMGSSTALGIAQEYFALAVLGWPWMPGRVV